MNSTKAIQLVKRTAAFFVGIFIIQIGVAMFLKLNLGSDPFTVFTQGVSKLLHITPGMANRIITFVLLLLVLLLDHTQVKIGTIVAVLCTGTFLDSALVLLSPLFVLSMSLPVKIVLFILGSITVGVGFTILKSADYGVAPNDSAYFVLVDRLHMKYSIIRMGVDSIYMIAGILFGGVVGIGTILSILLIGPIIQICMEKMGPSLHAFLGVQVKE